MLTNPALEELLKLLIAEPREVQLAALRTMTSDQLEQVDDVMSTWRVDYGHQETPHRSGDPALAVCDQCGALGDEEQIATPIFHPASISTRG